MNKNQILFKRFKIAFAAASAAIILAGPSMPSAVAGDAAAKLTKPIIEEPTPSNVNFLFNFEFANEYVTPRGMMVRDNGLTVQPLFLTFINVYKGGDFLNSVTLVAGCWNDLGTSAVSVHAPFGSSPKTPWTEIDPIAGVSFGFAKHFKLDVTYTAFVEQIEDIGTSQHLESKLSFDDSEYMGAFALHPYFSYWQELSGKATDADVPEAVFGPSSKSGSHPAPGSSYYFEVGVDPSYTFKDVLGGLKIEAPLRVLLPDERFYGNYYGSSSTVGLFELGLKGSIPLTFIPKGYGSWSFHVGFKYINFVDKNLYYLNTFNAPTKPTRDTWQEYAGVSMFF